MAEGTPSGQMVLVVDDDCLVLSLIEHVLIRAGHRVITAESGKKALTIAKTQPDEIGLLLTDVDMPVMSGLELARNFSRICPGVPVLFVSGLAPRSLETLSSGGQFEGKCRFIAKPFHAEELVESVCSLVGGTKEKQGQSAL